jgi:hypothetical protein
MKFLFGAKDGGPESRVWAWGLESKRFGSVLLLKFGRGSREAFHSHAFNATSWVLSGGLREVVRYRTFGFASTEHAPSLMPVRTYRETFHQVFGLAPATWVLSFRGPWADTWEEWVDDEDIVLTHGRKVVRA